MYEIKLNLALNIYIHIVHIFFFICLYVYILSCLVLNLNKKIKKKNKNIREKNNIKYVNVDTVIEVENRRVISERKYDEKLYMIWYTETSMDKDIYNSHHHPLARNISIRRMYGCS